MTHETSSSLGSVGQGASVGAEFDPDGFDAWVFDLDNTLYPAACDLFAQVDQRMGAFIAETLGLDRLEARALQKRYFREHGTTLKGLMRVHGIDPHAYLAYVHEIDVSVVPPSPRLDRLIDALPGRKIVYTNGSTAHAERVLQRLGVPVARFEEVFDIVAAEFVPKPDPQPFQTLVERRGLEPTRTVFVDDIPKNLVPAHAMGMTTVLVRTDMDYGTAPEEAIHYVAEDVESWLESVVGARVAPPAA